ncbi:MAG: hypothetical protein AVDCRST_MAG61-3245, partial [uncultured Friedmanniella sp.]
EQAGRLPAVGGRRDPPPGAVALLLPGDGARLGWVLVRREPWSGAADPGGGWSADLAASALGA